MAVDYPEEIAKLRAMLCPDTLGFDILTDVTDEELDDLWADFSPTVFASFLTVSKTGFDDFVQWLVWEEVQRRRKAKG